MRSQLFFTCLAAAMAVGCDGVLDGQLLGPTLTTSVHAAEGRGHVSAEMAAMRPLETLQARASVEPTASIDWRTDWRAAQAESRQSGKPLFVWCTMGAGCPGCVQAEANVWTDPAVVDVVERLYVPYRAGYEQSEAFMRRHGVRSFPSDLVLHADGRSSLTPTKFNDPAAELVQLARLATQPAAATKRVAAPAPSYGARSFAAAPECSSCQAPPGRFFRRR